MKSADEIEKARATLAAEHGYTPCPVRDYDKLGVSRNVKSGLMPINGVRSLGENGTNGWYIWAGAAMSEDPDFFEPLHVSHLDQWCPDVLPFLELPPGWRFQIAPGHQDVWFDPDVDLAPMSRDPDEPSKDRY